MISRIRIANAALYTLAAVIFATTAVFLYLFVAPMPVLKNWRIVAPAGNYHVGDTIIIQSLFTKLRPVDGVAHRSLECTGAQGADVAYPVNIATANHVAQAKAGVGIPIVIPLIPTPTKCRLAISIEYKIYPFRTVTEFATSNQFNVVK